jgi:DNA replication initiation complex subunit (GINS family)
MSPKKWCCIIAGIVLPLLTLGQNKNRAEQLVQLPNKFLQSVNKKVSGLETRLNKQTEKYLQRLSKREQKLKKKFSTVDSVAAKNLFNNTDQQYAALIDKLKSKTSAGNGLTGEYLPYTDSLKGILSFIDQNKGGISKKLQGPAAGALSQLKNLQDRFGAAEEAKQFIRQRKQLIKETLSRYSSITTVSRCVSIRKC